MFDTNCWKKKLLAKKKSATSWSIGRGQILINGVCGKKLFSVNVDVILVFFTRNLTACSSDIGNNSMRVELNMHLHITTHTDEKAKNYQAAEYVGIFTITPGN